MDEQFEELADKIKTKADKLGLYMRDRWIATHTHEMDEEMAAQLSNSDAIKARMQTGDVRVAIMAIFTVNEVAFSDRIQNPEAYDLDTQFRTLMPTEHDLKADEIRDRLRQNKGKLFNFEDDDEA